ncbi:hypothetical protein RRG08_061213 [Elysia crispata]|uniref:Uncharacterized protein n=1 Tax=Elysia crispata TaxID=231223 RepID=A0AAE0ZG29_9GAST|nr:hypothetical protein RRG08_061213 [Elysia crispata]
MTPLFSKLRQKMSHKSTTTPDEETLNNSAESISSKNVWPITRLFGGLNESTCTFPEPAKCADGHGKKSTAKYSDQDVISHTESHRPTLAHYHSKHALMRRCLPAEITVKTVYQDFKDKYVCEMSFSSFYGIFKSMKISTTLLGHEEC